jgi:hypothetical protein
MTVTVQMAGDGTILLLDDCPAEDAEPLLQSLLAQSKAAIDWSGCRFAHTSVIQVLIAAGRTPTGSPPGEFLRLMVKPALDRARKGIQPSRDGTEVRKR